MNQAKHVARSIIQRLLNRARTSKEDFNLLLSRYGMERFLCRLSVSMTNTQYNPLIAVQMALSGQLHAEPGEWLQNGKTIFGGRVTLHLQKQ